MNSMRVRWKVVLGGLAIAAPFVFILLVDSWFAVADSMAADWRVEQASVLRSRAEHPKALPADGWESVALPYRIEGDGEYPTSAWYRLEVSGRPVDDVLWAVFMTADRTNYVVYINGHFVGSSGRTSSPIPQFTTPQWFDVPGALLKQDGNRIDIQVIRDLRAVSLPAVFFGPAEELRSAFELRSLLDGTVKVITVACMLTLAMMMMSLFAMRTQEASFAWFALALICWATYIATRLTPTSPFDVPYLWIDIQDIALGAYIICTVFFVHRFLDLTRRKIEWIAAGWFWFGATVLIVDATVFGYQWPWFFGRVWFQPLMILGIYATWLLIRAFRANSGFENRILAAVAWFELVVGVSDHLAETGLFDRRPLYLTYTVGPVLTAFAIILLRRFIAALNEVEIARDKLEIRVAERSAELERKAVRVRELERQHTLNAERERLMREMHDGIGSELVQALSATGDRADLAELRAALERCMQELRLLVDSTGSATDNLATAIRNLRSNLSRSLRHSAVKLEWPLEQIDVLEAVSGNRVLSCLRIVQEAIANALKHANATLITVRAMKVDATCDSEHGGRHIVAIEIQDNGIGMSEASATGRGIRNMTKRAADANGEVFIRSSSAGTVVCLKMNVDPIEPQAEATRSEGADAAAASNEVSIPIRPLLAADSH